MSFHLQSSPGVVTLINHNIGSKYKSHRIIIEFCERQQGEPGLVSLFSAFFISRELNTEGNEVYRLSGAE